MARQTFRLNLSSADFPLLSHMYGRSVIYAQQDTNYVRPNAFSGAEADKNIGIPQVIFVENCMPTSVGMQSIGYLAVTPGTNNNDFDQAFTLRDAAENRTIFVPGVTGTAAKRYTYNPVTQAWSTAAIVIPSGAKCSVANLKSRTFVHFEFDDEFFEWTGAWGAIAYTGITAANIKGICSSMGYQIIYDYNTVYWSSITDPIDFVPSLSTGAGSTRVLGNKGRIVVCYPTDDGFVIYTTNNIIVARYSNNTRFPWVFKEIKNSSGLEDQERATPQNDGNSFYYYSTDGMLACSSTKAEQTFPFVSEFFGRRMFETVINNAFVLTKLTAAPKVKIEYVGKRWLVISYGITELQYALVFDFGLKRWGKLKVLHTDCFEFFGNEGSAGTTQALTWAQLNGTWTQQNNTWAEFGNVISGGNASITQPYRSLAFMQKNGLIKIVDFSLSSATDDAILMIGKVQFLRDRQLELLEVDAENMDADPATSPLTKLQIWTSLDGRNITSKVYPMRAPNYNTPSQAKKQSWLMRKTGQNHTLVFQGDFDLNSIVARGVMTGKR